jgi:gliding motility-associated-like protein
MKKFLPLSFLLSVLVLAFSINLTAQNFSNKGKDFWVGYGNHVRMFGGGGGAESMQIYLTSDVNTTGSIIFTSGTPTIPFTVTANQITVVQIPRSEFLNDEGLYSRGIHITALSPIVAYGFIYVNAISGATVYLPTNTLGKEYYSLNYRQLSNEGNSYSYFFVEAVEPGTTTVEITPTQTTKNGWLPNVAQTVNLTQGQIYQVLSTNDLTGSRIKSIAPPNGDCKKIAVFCGSGKISIGCSPLTNPTAAVGSSDNLYQQMYPYATWGKKYITVSSANTSTPNNLTTNSNRFRILRPDPTSIVTLNGAVIPALNFTSNYYDFSSNATNIIESDKPIMVAQYFTTASSGGGCPSGNSNPHDPEMIYLNPVEQTISDVTLNSMQPASNTAITQHFINVVVKNGGTGLSSFKIDGVTIPPTAFTVLPQDNSYSYARIWKQGGNTLATATPLASGTHRLVCDSGFNAIAYGFGSAESYGYSAGANLKDLTNAISIQNNLSILPGTDAVACTNSPFSLKMYLQDSALTNTGPFAGQAIPVRYDSIKWSITPTGVTYNNGQLFPYTVTPANQATLSGIPASNFPPHYPNPIVRPDSTSFVNGKTVKWYFFPYSLNSLTPGTYSVKVTGYLTNSVADCGSSTNERDFEFPLVVSPPPSADFTFTLSGCPADTVRFTEITPQTPYTTYAFYWNFGEPASPNNTANIRNPAHAYANASTNPITDYIVKHASINAAGCRSDTVSKLVTVPQLVNATISGTTALCQNDPQPTITFTATGGRPPYTFVYNINGGTSQTISTTGPTATSVTLQVPTSNDGTFAYNLTSVSNANPAFCVRNITGQAATVRVNPTPDATISSTTTVCQNAAEPSITFTGSLGTAPYTFTYRINSGAQQTISTVGASVSRTILVPTNVTGVFTYELLSVTDATSTLCDKVFTAPLPSATVSVQALANATISGGANVCQNGTAPVITFTGSNGNAPYTFTYNIGGGPSLTAVSSPTSSTATVTAPLTATGTFVYNLVSVQGTGAITCVRNLALSQTVVVNPVPSATITGTNTVCQGAAAQTITFAGTGGTLPYTFTYSLNGGTNQTITTSGGLSTATITQSTATAGTYAYSLISITDASTTLCTQTYAAPRPTATVIVELFPNATITGSTTVCQNAATQPLITLTGSNGVAPYTFTYNISGGTSQTVTTTAGSSTVTVAVPLTVGTFTYNLLSVASTGTQACTRTFTNTSQIVTVNPVPTATIAGSTVVCQNTTAPLVTFTGAAGTAPYTFVYTLNGGAQQTISSVGAANSVTLSQSTATPGTYNYVLIRVTDNSSTACSQLQAGNVSIVVRQLATATMVASAANICQNAATAPTITFTATGGVAPYIFNYTRSFNGGAPVALTATTTAGNSISIPVPVNTAGSYTYNLVSVTESSNANCVNPQTATQTVEVRPQPTASFTTSAPLCQFGDITFEPVFNITPTGSITSWVWNYGNGTGQQTRTDGNPFVINYATAGNKIVTFKTVSNLGCESVVFSQNVLINAKPIAGFINPEACLADTYAQFTDTSSIADATTITNWSWNFGDGSPIYSGGTTGVPSHQNPLHPYLTVGQKNVRLIVTTNANCRDTVDQSFFINGEVQTAGFTQVNTTNCSNRPVRIRDNSVVNVGGLIRVDIIWDFANNPTDTARDEDPLPTDVYFHNYPNLQVDRTYQVKYIAYSGFNGVCQKEVIVPVLVRASPVALFTTIPNVCRYGGLVTLNQGSIFIGAPGTTAAYSGPGIVNTAGTFDPAVTGPGTFELTYTLNSPFGCDSALKQTIKVLAPPVITSFETEGKTCVAGVGGNNAITFKNETTSTEGTIVKWIYNWNDGSPIQTEISGGNVTHSFTTIGLKTVTLTVETIDGCRSLPRPLTFTVNPLPLPEYAPAAVACLPTATVAFTNNSANLATNTYNWFYTLPNRANTSTGTNGSYTYTVLGPHTTRLIATNSVTGCKDSTDRILINNVKPEPVIRFDDLPDVCLSNGTSTYTIPLDNYASETSLILGGPGVYSCPAIPAAINGAGVFNPAIAGVGVHTIRYTWTSSFGCPAFKEKTIRVLAPPVVDTFYTVGNRCRINAITFANGVTQGAGSITQWIYNWGEVPPSIQTEPSGADVQHTYQLAQTYNATLTVVTGAGCYSTPKPLAVVINPLPTPDFRFTDTACLPAGKIDFVNNTPQLNTWAYQWQFFGNASGDGSVQVNPSYTYLNLGPHNVKLIATSPLTGCKDSTTKPVNSIHPAPLAKFSFNKPSVCIGDDVSVIDESTFADGTPKAWDWTWDDGSSATVQNPAPKTYAAANTYNVKLKVTNSFGCVDDTTIAFTVHPYPVINAGRDTVMLEGGQVQMVATATGNDLLYSWTGTPAPLNLSSPTVLNPIATPAADITYTLKVTARGGCARTDDVFVKVLKFPVIPNTFTPNRADSRHTYWEIKYLNSYPNNKVQVFTRTGQLVFESRGYLEPWDGNFNGKALPVDTYYYIIEPGSGRKPITGYVTIIK